MNLKEINEEKFENITVTNPDPTEVDRVSQMQTQVNKEIEKEKETYGVAENPQHDLDSSEVLTAINHGEDGDACLFVYRNKGSLVYDHKGDTWHVWRNKRWNPDQLNQHLVSFDSLIDIYVNEINNQNNKQIEAVKNADKDSEGKAEKITKSLLDRIKKLRQLNRRKNILKLASSGENSLGISGDEWDAQVIVLPCENGIYNLKTGEFREHRPEDYIKTIAPVEFWGLDIAAPVFEKFLFASFNNNKELIAFVQRLFGSAISGEVIEHRISIFWGEKGRNGKGTLLEIIKAVLGLLMSPIQAEMFLKQKHSKSSSAASPDILNLKGKRIVWASEIEEGRHLNVSFLKLLSGGDTLTARGVYEKTYTEFTPTHSVFMITNHRPHIPANENALWERVFLIPFELSFVDKPTKSHERKRDPHLKEKLLKEKPGILAWLLRGYHEYKREGLNPPEIVLQQVDQYKNDEDTIHGFIQECCDIRDDGMANSSVLYGAYRNYCKNNDLKHESHAKFGRILSKRFEKDRHQGKVCYKGIFLQIKY